MRLLFFSLLTLASCSCATKNAVWRDHITFSQEPNPETVWACAELDLGKKGERFTCVTISEFAEAALMQRMKEEEEEGTGGGGLMPGPKTHHEL